MIAVKVESFDDVLKTKDEQIFYFKDDEFDIWYFYYPGQGFINIINHGIEENEDGTITVEKEIVVNEEIKGTLTNGNWKQKQ